MTTAPSLTSSSARLPDYLRPYVVEQHWEQYTPRHHATWRFIMRQAREFFRSHAHASYLEGLEKTGIPISEIPRIEDMDARLQKLGWGAVCVCGFIPPLTFLDFQSRKLLPIAADMRSLEHLTYTPAPDIVHEAAGHAPILADPAFAHYLTSYANLARKAIFSIEDIKLYEAIRYLSDIKENPDSSLADIAQAEAQLEATTQGMTWVSEAAQVARMNWWTAEYGLIGSLEHPAIFGAGLLSSLGEGRSCLAPEVKKLRLSLACIEQSYDITRPQPQLFVASSFKQLTELLDELGSRMAFSVGGSMALAAAQRAQTVTTTVLDSGLEISGILGEIHEARGGLSYLKWQGRVQLCHQGRQLEGQGTARHSLGFSGPLGPWAARPEHNPASLNDADLAGLKIIPGQKARVELASGISIEGTVTGWQRSSAGKLLVITWDHCKVALGNEVLFDPAWGAFDQPIGVNVVSVYGGPADRQAYGPFYIGTPSSTPGRRSPYSSKEKDLFSLYQRTKEMRSNSRGWSTAAFKVAHEDLSLQLMAHYPEEWLLGIELLELLEQRNEKLADYPWMAQVKTTVLNPSRYPEAVQRSISLGLTHAACAD